MQKIVMRYCSDQCETVLCFNYESPEAFLLDFEAKLKEVQSQVTEVQAAWNAWNDNKPKGNIMHSSVRKAVVEYMKNTPKPPSIPGEIKFCNYSFWATDFCRYNPDRIVLPEVFTLEEWHANCVAVNNG